jgi:hypothetical protein
MRSRIKNEWPDIPVLLTTGYADRVLGNDIGLPKVTKPYMQRELAEAIVRMNPPRRKPERVVSLRSRAGPCDFLTSAPTFGAEAGAAVWRVGPGDAGALPL